jgi:FolB domain-containing protein
MNDVVGVRGLRVETVIGVREHERYRLQPIDLDIECEVDVFRAALDDDLTKTVSYSDIAATVRSVAAAKSHGLLESLAEDCVTTLLQRFNSIQVVRIEIRKPLSRQSSGVPFVRLLRRRAAV